MDLEPSFLELRLLFWRQAFIDMKQNCLSASNVRTFRSVKQHSTSEVDARRWLLRTHDALRKLRDEESKSLRRRYGIDAEYGAVRSYFTGERGLNCPMFQLLGSRLWDGYVVFVREQILRSQRGEQSYSHSYWRVCKLFGSSIFHDFFKHYFIPQISFISQDAQSIRQYPAGVETTYVALVGFTAANIAIYPELERSLRKARPDLATPAALVSELIGEVVAMTPALLKAELELVQLPQLAASSIQQQFYVSNQECLTDQVLEIESGGDPEAIAITRGEVRFCLENLSAQQRLIAHLLATDYERTEIAEVLNVGTESVKTQITRLRYKARELRAA